MFLLVILLVSALTFAESMMVRSDRVTEWGNWGHLDQCPPGSFVKAINIKVESWQSIGDDSALNAVHLSCVPLDHQMTDHSYPLTKVLKSAEGPWGDFKGIDICYRGVATGFLLKSEDWQRDGDDSAANDIRLICSNSNGEQMTPIKGQRWGKWQNPKRCPPRTAVCGLQTQVEPRQGAGDDSALNNVDLKCCDLPNPATTCHPDDDWHEILRRDNSLGTSPIKYAVREKVGVRKSHTVTQSSSVIEEIAFTTGFGVGVNILGKLGANFETKLSTSTKTEHRWSKSETNVFTVEREEITEISIPARCDTRLYQIVGNCGPYVVNSNVIKRIDRCFDDRRSMHTNVTHFVIGRSAKRHG